MTKECDGEGATHFACPCFLENQQKSFALQRELVEALEEAVTTAISGYRTGAKSVERWKALITRADKTV
jgi:hypothetical protein